MSGSGSGLTPACLGQGQVAPHRLKACVDYLVDGGLDVGRLARRVEAAVAVQGVVGVRHRVRHLPPLLTRAAVAVEQHAVVQRLSPVQLCGARGEGGRGGG